MKTWMLIAMAVMITGCASAESHYERRSMYSPFFKDGEVKDGTLTMNARKPDQDVTMSLVKVSRPDWDGHNAGQTDAFRNPDPLTLTADGSNVNTTVNVGDCQRLYLKITCPHNTTYEHLVVVYGEVLRVNGHSVTPLLALPHCHCFEEPVLVARRP